MEIVLQWLDDLDDAVFAGVLAWERLRVRCLRLGFVSACALAACAFSAALDWAPILGGVAAASLAVVLLGALLAYAVETAARPPGAPRLKNHGSPLS